MGIFDYFAATSPRQAERIRQQKRRRQLAKHGHTPASFSRLTRMENARLDKNARGLCAASRCSKPVKPVAGFLAYCCDEHHDRDRAVLDGRAA